MRTSALPATTISDVLKQARASGVASLDAQVLLAHVLGRSRTWLHAYPEFALDSSQTGEFTDLLERRRTGTPVAHFTATRAFFGLDFHVTPAVLVPRPETEHLVQAALDWAGPRQPLAIADAGTGSGAIAVSLAVHLPEARIVATDTSADALAVAARNAIRHEVTQRIALLQADLLAPLVASVDLIVSNPPYISTADLSSLEVARHEPHAALDGGPDGLAVIRRLLAQSAGRLARPGLLLLEVGAGQAGEVAALARRHFPDAAITSLPDYAGHERVIRIARGGAA